MSRYRITGRSRLLRNGLSALLALAALPATALVSVTPAAADTVLVELFDGPSQTGNHITFTASGYYDLSTVGWVGRIKSWRVAGKYPTSADDGNGIAFGMCVNLEGVDGPARRPFMALDGLTHLDIGRTCGSEVLMYTVRNFGSDPHNCESGSLVAVGFDADNDTDVCANLDDPNEIDPCPFLTSCIPTSGVTYQSVLLPYGGVAAVGAENGACRTVTRSVGDLATIGLFDVVTVTPGESCDSRSAFRYGTQDFTVPSVEIQGDNPAIEPGATYAVRCPDLVYAYSGPAYSGSLKLSGTPTLLGTPGPDGTSAPDAANMAGSYRCPSVDGSTSGVVLYTDAAYAGTSIAASPPVADFAGLSLPGAAHSVVNPLSTSVALFVDRGFRGACLEIPPTSYVPDITATLLGRRSPQSMAVGSCPPSPVLELVNVNSGTTIMPETPLVLTNDIPDLSTHPFGTEGFSVINPSSDPVALFTGTQFTGTCLTVLPGQTVDLADTAIGADNAKSLLYNRPCPGQTVQRTLYVDPSGTSASCTAPGPDACPTPQQAIDEAQTAYGTGDDVTIDVAAGDYKGNFTIGGSGLNSLVIVGAGAGKTVFDGNDSGTVLTLPAPNGVAEPVIVVGLTITGGNGSATAPGGVSSRAPLLTLSNDAVVGNTGLWGGILTVAPGGLYMWNDTVADNSGTTTGALGAEGATAVINTTIAGNTADNGPGGVLVDAPAVRFINDTFSGNSDRNTDNGPLVFNDIFNPTSANTRVTNSILADDHACQVLAADPNNPGTGGGLIVGGGYNVERADTCGFGSTSVVNSGDIDLGPLASNGGDARQTMAIDPTSSAFEEVPASACTQHTDELRNLRPGVPRQACDAGAFEYQQPEITVTVSATETFGSAADFTETDDAPTGVSLTGGVDCTTAGGTPVGQLHAGFYGLDGASCSGLSAAGYTVVYIPGTITVTPAVPTTPSISNDPNPADTGSSFMASIITNGDGATFLISESPTVCHVGTDGRTVSLLSTGTCTLVPEVAAGSDYQGASGPPDSFPIYEKPTFTSPDTADFTYGSQGAFELTTSGTPTAAIVALSALPDGLTFAASSDGTAMITGTPTVPAGSYPAMIAAANLGGSTTQTLTILVHRATPTQPVIANLPNPGVWGTSFVADVTTTGDGATSVSSSTPAVCSVGSDELTVQLIGTGTCQLTAAVAAGARYTASTGDAQSFQVGQQPAFTSPDSSVFTVGLPGSFTVTSTGVPTSALHLTSGSLPSGVTFAAHSDGTAVISGTPGRATTGAYQADLTATNIAGEVTQAFTLTVRRATPTITASISLASTTYGRPVTVTAHVAPPVGDVLSPSGQVGFFVDGASTPAATVTLSNGIARWTTSLLHAGLHSIASKYLGDANFDSASAASLSVTVARAATTLRASALLFTRLLPTARLTRTDNGAPISGQLIRFSAGGRFVCTAVTDVRGYAICKVVVISWVGITATFAGNGDFKPSTGSAGFL